MKVAVFSSKPYDKEFFRKANEKYVQNLVFFEAHLNEGTAPLAKGFPAICAFVVDHLNQKVLEILAQQGTKLVALRSAGFNNVDLRTAERLGITVVRVPSYSPHAVAEHTLGLILALNRKIHRAHQRVREGNFSLHGLMGFDLNGKSVGVIGTGKIGAIVANILQGFGCVVLANDLEKNPQCEKVGIKYVNQKELFAKSDIITLHCPLTPKTRHLINRNAISEMKPGVMLINTSRGAVIDTEAVLEALKGGKIGSLGIDVYEEENDVFFEDLSDQIIKDDVLARLLTFPNVLITGHQAFFTEEALNNIAETTLKNIRDFEQGRDTGNEVRADRICAS